MRPPAPLQGSDPLTKWLNKLREYCIANEVKTVRNGKFERGASGTHITVNPKSAQGGETNECPL